MDDAEAEAVLLALGPQLEWKTGTPEKARPYWYAVPDRFHGYVIHSTRRWLPPFGVVYQAKVLPVGKVLNPYRLRTLADAKAACERHHATGKWG